MSSFATFSEQRFFAETAIDSRSAAERLLDSRFDTRRATEPMLDPALFSSLCSNLSIIYARNLHFCEDWCQAAKLEKKSTIRCACIVRERCRVRPETQSGGMPICILPCVECDQNPQRRHVGLRARSLLGGYLCCIKDGSSGILKVSSLDVHDSRMLVMEVAELWCARLGVKRCLAKHVLQVRHLVAA
ncbi:hypothetical protein L7F22_066261 [Adiantum nelumboides]|nr:hypothetical protein [Adiantum nelumboides]